MRMQPDMAITRYSVDDYEEMVRLGVLTENDRVELIRGEIVPKMAIGPKHGSCLKRFNSVVSERARGRAIVGTQPDGTYRETRILTRGQSTDIAALPGIVVAVDEVL